MRNILFFIFASCELLKRHLYVLQNTCTQFIGFFFFFFFLPKIYKAELYGYISGRF